MKAKDVVGKTVVLTGKFSELERAEAEAALGRLGATIGSGVSKTTDILFVGERAGSKLAKAKQLGIEIADEATLVAVLAEAPKASKASKKKAAVPSKGQAKVDAFAGKVIALTGTFTTMKRDDAKTILTEAGASVGSGVTKKTDLLIYGDNAGSKLDKAHQYGVAMMTEAEMVALLTAGGGGAGQLADAGDKLAKKAAEDAASGSADIKQVVAELRAFVGALEKRKDIRVTLSKIGRKAGKSKLSSLEYAQVPQELIDLYAEMDGAHVEWEFVEPPGRGCLRIPAVSPWTKFTGEDEHYMGFGDDREALLFDEITAEGGTWLVRKKKKKRKPSDDRSASLIFAAAAEGSDGVYPADSIADYLRKAMKNAFVGYWPRCFSNHPRVSYAEFESTIERFQAGPVTPAKISTAGRVHFTYFSGGGRGEVLSKHKAPAGPETRSSGQDFLEVRLDLGGVAWIPTKSTKGWTKRDAYERLRDPSFDLAAQLEPGSVPELLDDITRAILPLIHWGTYSFGSVPSNARLAAGLLATRSLEAATELVADLFEATTAAGLKLDSVRKIEKTGEEINASELSRAGQGYRIDGVFEGLCGGLRILAHHASAQAGVAPSKLVPAKLRKRVSAAPGGRDLSKLLNKKEVLEPICWSHAEKPAALAKALGLPKGAIVLLGEGL